MAQTDKRGSQFATAAKQSFRDSAQAALAPFGFPVTLTARLAQALRSQQARDALAKKFERVTSLDPQEQTLTDMAVEGVASLAPVVGQALAFRDVERARRSNDPAEMAMATISAIPGTRLAKLLGKYDPTVSKISDFDPRFDKRVKEREKLQKLTPVVESRGTVSAPDISITELEGMPFITSMSDRTAAGGLLKAINDVELSRPVDLRGGQDFMFENPGMVWASGKTPTKQIKELAEEVKVITGENPLYLPWRMAPSGVDFAAMTGEAMLNYADASLSKSAKRQLDAELKAIIPNWAGVSNPKSVQQYQNAKASDRKKIQRGLDKNFREQGGLGLGEARLSVTDPRQYVAPDAGVQNVGRIFADKPLITASGHPSYPIGVPGEGIGRIKENVNIFELLEPVVKARNIPDPKAPRQTDVRALQMKPYYGRITADLLKKMGF